MKRDWIQKVNSLINKGRQKKLLEGAVLDVGGQQRSEYDMLMELLDYYSGFQLDDREMEITNFAKDSTKEIIAAVVADFKESEEKSRMVKPIDQASIDDIVVVPLTPDIFKDTHTWLDEDVAAGEYDFIPHTDQAAGEHGVGEVTAGGAFQIDKDNVRIVITDLVDMIGSRNIQKSQYTIDEETQLPFSFPNHAMFGNVNVIPLPAVEVIRIRMDWDFRVFAGADVHMVPWGVAIMIGEDYPAL